MKWELRGDGYYLIDSQTGAVLDGPFTEQEARVFSEAAGIPFGESATRTITSGDWRGATIEDLRNAYARNDPRLPEATYRDLLGQLGYGPALIDAEIARSAPETPVGNQITPPSFEGAAGGGFVSGVGRVDPQMSPEQIAKGVKEGLWSAEQAYNALLAKGYGPQGATDFLRVQGAVAPGSTIPLNAVWPGMGGGAGTAITGAPQGTLGQFDVGTGIPLPGDPGGVAGQGIPMAGPPEGFTYQTRTYSPMVEQWRPLVEQYFRPEDVDKALYVINGESGGNPTIVNPSSGATGLFQILQSHGVNGADAETSIRWAANQVYNVRGNWGDWGEGVLYQGQPFGVLGFNPYPGPGGETRTATGAGGGAAGGLMPALSDEGQLFAKEQALERFRRGEITEQQYNEEIARINAQARPVEQQTAKEQIMARFRAGQISEAQMNAELQALAAQEVAAAKAREKQAIEAAIAQYQAQGIRVFRNQDGTLRLEDQNPQSPTFGQVRAAAYNPQTGQMETSDPVSSGAVRARGYSRQIESTGQLPLTPQQAAISSYLGDTYGGAQFAAGLMGREGGLSNPELSAVMGYPTSTGNFAAMSFANADKGPPVFGLGEALRVAAGPTGYGDVVAQRRAAIGLPDVPLAALAGGGGTNAADVRAQAIDWYTPGGAITAPPQFLPSTPEQLDQLVDRRVAKWNLTAGGRNPLGITAQERAALMSGTLPEGYTPEEAKAALGGGTVYTRTIGGNTETLFAPPDVEGADPSVAARHVARAAQNFSMSGARTSRGETIERPGIYITGPDGKRYGPFASQEEASAFLQKLAIGLIRQQDQRQQERADLLAGKIPQGSLTGGMGTTRYMAVRPSSGATSSRPETLRPPVVTPPPAPLPVYDVPNYGGGPLIYQPKPLLQQHGGVNVAGMATPLASMAGPMNAGSHLDLMGRQRFPLMLNQGGGFNTPEEIAMVGRQTGRVYAVAGEGADGLGGMVSPERITVQPEVNPQMNQLAMLAAAKYPVEYQLAGVR